MNDLNHGSSLNGEEKVSLFNELYRKHYDMLINCVSNAMNYRNPEMVEDIVQETFYELWRKMDDLVTHPNHGGWLVETARNKLRALRRRAWNREIGLEDCAFEPSSDMSEFSKVEMEMMVANLLNGHERELFLQYFVEGYSAKEMARREQMTENAFKVKMHRIRNKVQKEIND